MSIETTTVAGCRAVEAKAFREAANLLEAAVNGGPEIVAQALQFNQLLWSLILADVTEADNLLPIELKASVVSLSIFVENQSTKFESTGAADLPALANINRTLADGLSA